MAKKRTHQIRQKPLRPNDRKAARAKGNNCTKLTICYYGSKTNAHYDLLGQLSQKIENYMSGFYTLLALGSTNTPVILRIIPSSVERFSDFRS